MEAYYNADEGVEVDEILDVSQLPLETETFGELRLPEPAIVKLQAGQKTCRRVYVIAYTYIELTLYKYT